jgi:hypothetical protein
MPSLPTVSSDIPRDLRQFIDRLRENIDGRGLDEIITARKLVAAGLAQYSGGNLGSSTGNMIYATPPPPLNLDADGAIANIIVTWDKAPYQGHAYTEIWASQQTQAQADADPETYPTLGEAVLVGMAPGSVWVHNIGAGGSRWYWIRFVNVEGVAGPFNAVDGLRGDTGQDPAYLIGLLSNQISESELAQTLTDRINLIDGGEDVAGSVAARVATIQGQVNELLNLPTWDSSTAYAVDDQIVYEGFLYSALAASTNVTPGTDDTKWEKIGEYSTLGAAVAAHTTQIDTLQDADTSRISEISTLASQLRGDYVGDDVSLVAQGLIHSEREARSAADTALASEIETFTAFANTKSRVFYQATEPSPTADKPLSPGDLWIDTAVTLADDYIEGDYAINSMRMYRYDGTAWVNAMDFGFADWFSAIRTEKTSRVTEDEALAASIQTLVTSTNNSLATINSTLNTHTTDISSTASDVTSLTSTVGTNNTALEAALEVERTARSTQDSALSSQITTTQASLGDDITAAVSVERSARVGADGAINARNTVKIDNAGHITGYGLIASQNNASPTSEFGIRADTFFLAPPTFSRATAPTTNLYKGKVWSDTSGANPVTKYYTGSSWSTEPQNLPFIVRSSPTTINGVTAPPGVYITDAFIADGTISNAKIGNLAVDDAKIAAMDAAKITAGFIDAARIQAGSLDSTKIDTRGLSIKDNNGNIVLQAGTPLKQNMVEDLGELASYNTITLAKVSDAGDLAGKDAVNHADLSSELAGRLDGKVESFFQSSDPQLGWSGNDEKSLHLGDLWWKTNNKTLHRYRYSGGAYNWEELHDQTSIDAYHNASAAQDTADGKRRVFVSTPTTPYDVGDLWDRGATVGLYRCKVGRGSGSYKGSDWQKVADTTSENAAASIANQGDFATLDKVTKDNISTYISNGAITNAYIGNTIQSANYSATEGWKIDKSGAMTMNNATFRGALDIKGNNNTNRLNITNTKIEVIDSSNQVRVRIGKLD